MSVCEVSSSLRLINDALCCVPQKKMGPGPRAGPGFYSCIKISIASKTYFAVGKFTHVQELVT
jgi:hypothetical protein